MYILPFVIFVVAVTCVYGQIFGEGMFGQMGGGLMAGQMGGGLMTGQMGMMGGQGPLGHMSIAEVLSLIPNQGGSYLQTQIPASALMSPASQFIPLHYQQMIANGVSMANQKQPSTASATNVDPDLARTLLSQITVQQALALIPQQNGNQGFNAADVPAFVLNDPASQWIPAQYHQQIIDGLTKKQSSNLSPVQ